MNKDNDTQPINCKECGALFKPKRKWHEFCKSKCRALNWRKSHPYISPEELKAIKEKLRIDQ